jgi:hypothetical protein
VNSIDDPRQFPGADAAAEECARLHRLAAASQSTQGGDATALDRQIVHTLSALLAPGNGDRLAAVFATSPTVAVHRHLWRLLVRCEQETRAIGNVDLAATLFAIPVVVIAGVEGDRPSQHAIPCVLDDDGALAAILREHGALAGNQTTALSNVLVSTGAIDLPRLPGILAWRAFPEAKIAARELEPSPIVLSPGAETVHLRFLLGTAIAAPGVDLLVDERVGPWGMPFTRELTRQLAASAGSPIAQPDPKSGVSVLALPRAPQSLLRALRQGRASQREVGARIFASNAIRKLRASVGEPTAVISAHRAPDAIDGGELRLSLSSPFDPREAEGFRCPLHPLDRVEDVLNMLTDLLAECRVTDVRVAAGIHADRDPATGLPLLFKGDVSPAAQLRVH